MRITMQRWSYNNSQSSDMEKMRQLYFSASYRLPVFPRHLFRSLRCPWSRGTVLIIIHVLSGLIPVTLYLYPLLSFCLFRIPQSGVFVLVYNLFPVSLTWPEHQHLGFRLLTAYTVSQYSNSLQSWLLKPGNAPDTTLKTTWTCRD